MSAFGLPPSPFPVRTFLMYGPQIVISSLIHMDCIHPFAGNLAHELNVEVDEVVKSGTGLAFISYPTAIGKFEWMPQLFSVLFFLMLITLGLGRHSTET